jgi:hypothetical protein
MCCTYGTIPNPGYIIVFSCLCVLTRIYRIRIFIICDAFCAILMGVEFLCLFKKPDTNFTTGAGLARIAASSLPKSGPCVCC